MKQSRTAGPSVVVESPTVRSLPLVEFLVDTKAELFELMAIQHATGVRLHELWIYFISPSKIPDGRDV